MSQAGSEREAGGPGADEPAHPELDALRQDVRGLTAGFAEVRRDLALVNEVLSGLTLLVEATDDRLTGLAETQRSVATDQRAATAQAASSMGRTLSAQGQQVESQLVQLVARMAALDDVRQELGRTRDGVSGLASRAVRADERSERLAAEQALALDGVTAAIDAVGGAVGAIEAAVGAMVRDSRAETVDAVDARLQARLGESSASIDGKVIAHLDQALSELGISQLRRSVAEVAEQVAESRADARTINASIASFDDRVALTTSNALLPITTALGRVRLQIEAAAEGAASTGDIEELRASLEKPLLAFQDQLEAAATGTAAIAESLADALRAEIRDQLGTAAEGTAALAADLADSLRSTFTEHLTKKLTEADAARQTGMEQLALQLTDADAARQAGIEELSQQLEQQLRRADEQRTAFTEQVTNQLSQADVARHEGVERILAEVLATREAAERRTGSRWRRGTGDDPPAPARGTASEHEQRVDQALRDLDLRLTSLAQLVERAGAFADDAAQASIATFRAVTTPPPADTATPTKPAANAKKTAARASTTKKAATKRVSSKKGAPRKDTGEPPAT